MTRERPGAVTKEHIKAPPVAAGLLVVVDRTSGRPRACPFGSCPCSMPAPLARKQRLMQAMVQFIEQWQRASMHVIRHARELQNLAAARTKATALAVLESSLRRQTLHSRPHVLPVGTQCRVSRRVSSTVRQQLKVQLVKALRPPYTRELYTVTARHRRSELYLYDLEMAAVGEQGAAIVGGLRVQLPETLYRVDRRSIMPNTADVMYSLATRFPEKTYTTSMFAGIVRANGQDNVEVYGEDQDNDNET